MCPAKKEYVSIKTDTFKQHKQKRLLLTNLKELHLQFLKQSEEKIILKILPADTKMGHNC